MAQYTIPNGGNAGTIRAGMNGNFDELYAAKFDVGTSATFPDGESKQLFQEMVGPSANNKALEIVNIGYTGHGASDLIHQNATALVRVNGRLDMVRNMEWDQLNAKWLTPLQDASAYGSVCVELGGEAVILHATPSGVNFSDVFHEIFRASANGTDGPAGQFVSSGYFCQAQAPLYARFSSATYNPATTNASWNETTGADPLLWLSSGEAKGSKNEFARLEMNANSGSAYASLYFAKSRGTLGSKTIVTTDTVTGRIAFDAYDGSQYHTTAVIEGVARGTMAADSVGQGIRIAVSPDTTANLATKFEIRQNGNIGFFGVTPASRQVVATGSTADQIITALQNLGLFSQS